MEASTPQLVSTTEAHRNGGRKRKRKHEGPHIFWRGGRAYADLRAYEDVGGGKEALCEPGKKWGTKDEQIAEALFAARLAELQAKRANRVGVKQHRSIRLAPLVRDHLIKKAKGGNLSLTHMNDLETRLRAAINYFGGGRDLRSIEPADVGAWADHLASGGKRKPGTVRHYLNALSGLYGRAQEGLYVDPGYNPVSALQEKPTGHYREETFFFEVADAALLLEAARVVEARDRVNATPSLYAIVATFLLTGGRGQEVLGLEVEDISFDRGLVRFRPNQHRELKTKTSHRTVPLWPQLRDILQPWLYDRPTPRTSGLLFTTPGGEMVGDLRKSFDDMAELCGFDEKEVRTRPFRHTYCSARLQTVNRILKPGKAPDEPDAWEYVEVSKFQVQKEMGHGGAQLVDRIYGHAQRNPYRSEVVEYRVEKHKDALGDRLTALVAAR